MKNTNCENGRTPKTPEPSRDSPDPVTDWGHRTARRVAGGGGRRGRGRRRRCGRRRTGGPGASQGARGGPPAGGAGCGGRRWIGGRGRPPCRGAAAAPGRVDMLQACVPWKESKLLREATGRRGRGGCKCCAQGPFGRVEALDLFRPSGVLRNTPDRWDPGAPRECWDRSCSMVEACVDVGMSEASRCGRRGPSWPIRFVIQNEGPFGGCGLSRRTLLVNRGERRRDGRWGSLSRDG